MSGFDAGNLRSLLNYEPKAGISVAEVSPFLVQQSPSERERHFVEYETYADVTD